ncbi:hypothetical protein C8250_001160 [Streptomyces sp. So13.3]|uniref:hypothetical protein n=1 Tax=Streptomyces TaxID=1883 RepID=UPI001105A081|nr:MULTISPECIES: hypothetical protein [Streptomyces]MCZ4096888.1 hypothetical protein [Streptomyces sp. H39-C1]QNA70736.1 hypothetical protein C8250_001160 [Streptomyces sp. So13.3]
MWKFLAEHVYHPVELLGEGDEDRWITINRDFTSIDDDAVGNPTLAQYIGHWPGRALAQHPRPMAEAVALAVLPQGSRALRQQSLAPADIGVVRALYRSTRWPEDPSDEVDDAALTERLAKLRTGLDALRDAARSGVPDLARPMEECVRILAPAHEFTHAILNQDRDAYAPPALFDAERALGLIHDWAWSVGPDE